MHGQPVSGQQLLQADRQGMLQALHDKFAPMMRHQVMMMTEKGHAAAELKLDPPELGLIHIRIQMQGEQTQIQFQVQHQQTRDLPEQSMLRLRDLLQQQGFSLTDGHVGQQKRETRSRTRPRATEHANTYQCSKRRASIAASACNILWSC